jgi:hypothetical protein
MKSSLSVSAVPDFRDYFNLLEVCIMITSIVILNVLLENFWGLGLQI